MSDLPSFDAFISLRRSIESGTPYASALKDAGVSEVQWVALSRRWLRAMAREAERGGGDLTRRYLSGFGDIVAPASTPAPTPALTPVEAPAPAPLAVPAPRFPMPPARPQTAAMPAIEIDAFGIPLRNDGRAAPRPIADEVAREAKDMVGETALEVMVDTGDDRPVSVREAPSVDETADIGVIAGLAALPFGKKAAHDVDETMDIGEIFLGDILPFESDSEGASPAPVAREVALEAAHLAGRTAIAEVVIPPPAVSGSSPQAPPASGPVEGGALANDPADTLTVEQYASLRADLDRGDPTQRADILARYFLVSDDAFVALKRVWAARFAEAPAEYGRFRAAYDAYAQWLGAT